MTISSSQELFNQDTPYYKAVMDRAGHKERLMFKVMEDVMEKSKQRYFMEQQYQNKCRSPNHLQHQETEGVLQDHLQHEFSHQSQHQEDSLWYGDGQCKEGMEL
jgi:hypothetical protein